jgi:hypothetical protein
MRILLTDVGGPHVKVLATGKHAHQRVESGPTMTTVQLTHNPCLHHFMP